jgi:ERCC4-type nuclease
MHVSSTEPAQFHTLGETSTLPEKYGVDFLWFAKGWCGVQRKEVKDLAASLRDGRLGREVAQMGPLRQRLLVVEGMLEQVGASILYRHQNLMSLAQWQSTLWGLQEQNIKILFTRNKAETAMAVDAFERWTKKERHTALAKTRDSVRVNSWGKSTDRDFQIHMLTGIPGVGRGTAEAVVDHFGGMPITWTVTEDELCQVPGIGKVKAQRMVNALST